MIDNDEDNGVESQFIDPFVTVSNEAYPFPVEDYIQPEQNESVQAETPVAEVENIIVPTINDNGVPEISDSLRAIPDDTVTVPSVDTPAQPLDKPEGKEVRISLEESESIDNDIAILAEITKIRDQLMEIGGISKADVVAFEAYYPKAITETIPLNRFSAVSTRAGFVPSLESIADSIIKLITSIITWILGVVKKIIAWVLSVTKNTSADNLFDVKTRWVAIENLAKRIDATGNRDKYRTAYAKKSYAAKSANTLHFIKLHADSVMVNTLSNFNDGMQAVQKGNLYNETKAIVGNMQQMCNWIMGGMNSFKVGAVVRPYTDHMAGEAYNLDKYPEYLAKVDANYSEQSTPTIKNFVTAINVKDVRASIANDMANINKTMGNAQDILNTIEQKLSSSKENVAYDIDSLRTIKNGMKVLVALSSGVDLQLRYFTKYCSAMMMVIHDCDRTLLTLHY